MEDFEIKIFQYNIGAVCLIVAHYLLIANIYFILQEVIMLCEMTKESDYPLMS